MSCSRLWWLCVCECGNDSISVTGKKEVAGSCEVSVRSRAVLECSGGKLDGHCLRWTAPHDRSYLSYLSYHTPIPISLGHTEAGSRPASSGPAAGRRPSFQRAWMVLLPPPHTRVAEGCSLCEIFRSKHLTTPDLQESFSMVESPRIVECSHGSWGSQTRDKFGLGP